MLADIPFTIPAEFTSGLADGSIVRIGALLKEASTGRIVAHVQETGLAQQLLSGAQLIPFSPFDVGSLASSTYANIQLNQLKAMVDGLQLLGFANLGVATAGLGVSMIGFMLVNKRLKGIEGSISNLSDRIDQHFKKLHEREIRQHLTQIGVLLERVSQIGHRKDPAQAWLATEEALALEAGFLAAEIAAHLEASVVHTEWFETLTSALLLANAVRIQCLLNGDELDAARHTAIEVATRYRELFDTISPSGLAIKMMAASSPDPRQELAAYRVSQLRAQRIAADLREVTEVALTKPLLLEHLIKQEISGTAFLAEIGKIESHPVVLLTV